MTTPTMPTPPTPPAPPAPPVHARLHVLFAREANVGVVIRRGPTKMTRLILWNLESGQFTPGQWLKARIYERRCDLATDGTRLIYFAYDGRQEAKTPGSYTAISRPPYWSPVVLWPKADSDQGGGLFLDGMTLWLNGEHGKPVLPPPGKLRVVAQSPYPVEASKDDLSVYFPRLKRDGWVRLGEETDPEGRTIVRWEKRRLALTLLKRAISAPAGEKQAGKGNYYDEHDLIDSTTNKTFSLPDAEWADFDRANRLSFASLGKLFRASVLGGELKTRELADFNAMKFESVPPPKWATKWEGTSVSLPRTQGPMGPGGGPGGRGGGRHHARQRRR